MSGIVKVSEQIRRPTEKRICIDCQGVILRNLAITADGQPHHWGCLKKDHAQPAFVCANCGAALTRAQAPKLYVDGVMSRGCGVCGGTYVVSYAEHVGGFEVVH